MKKIFFALASLLLFATSCSNIDDIGGTGKPEQPATVSVNLGLPQMQTRAYSDGKTAKKLEYAVYDITAGDNKILEAYTKQGADAEEINISKPVSFQLVTGHTYGFVFWASSKDAPYEVKFTEDGATMTADYDDVTANNETLDAFYAYEVIEVNGDLQADVNLYRPFAQINVGTNDYEAAASIGYAPTQSAVTVSEVYSAFDLISGEVTGDADEVSFGFGTIPPSTGDDAESFPMLGYDYLAMVYILADKEQAVTDVTFQYRKNENDAEKSRTVGSVPVQRNHRTNIFGQILTSNADLEVTIIPDYDDPQFDLKLAGVEFEPGTGELGKEGATFKISSREGLEWLATQVNNHGSHELVSSTNYTYGAANVAFNGQKIVLTDDIDMAGVNWTPIGYETKENGASNYAFAGEFDGNGKTISNLTVTTEKNSNAGLFGATNRATIKGVTLKNVNIKSHYKTGAIVGDGYNARIEDCHVIGGTINVTPWEIKSGVYDDANNVGGIVGYLNGQPEAAWAKGCTVDGLTITAFRKVGGIAGVVTRTDDKPAGQQTSSVELSGCKVSNTTIIADMSETRYDGYASKVPDIGKIYGVNATPTTNVDTDPTRGVTIQGNTDENVTTKVIVAATSETFASVISNATEGQTIKVAAGTYSLPTKQPVNGVSFKGITIEGAGSSTVFNIGGSQPAGYTDVTFKKVKFVGGTNYAGMQHSKNLKFEDCEIEGQVFAYAAGCEYTRCVFNATTDYCIWTYTSSPISFTDCEFNAPIGKAVLIYHEAGIASQEVNFNNCTFKASAQTVGKAAIEIGTGGVFTVNINNCTAEGFANGNRSGNSLWNHKEGNNLVTVSVNGQQVYTTPQE